ncbi:MAG: pilus assembly protein PilO [Gammaproteobacteria bacterium]|nr:MAG: pilus assembly protein PilO [Gammaproteobacteria bacterium]RLA22931.1 MAG: pilus assembly protein PilO [Gammaproteobacteria bacterium]
MNLSEINWDLDSAGKWPLPIKIATVILFVILTVGLWIYMDTQDQLAKLEGVEKKELDLRAEFEGKQRKAVNLDAYKQQLVEMEESFGAMLRQLPNKTEVADLLVDVSQTGLASGLEFELFKPQGEVPKDFYAELPIKVQVVGDYLEFGGFVSGLASLPRIVTIHDAKISPIKGGERLRMEATVKTYRYLDEDEGQ